MLLLILLILTRMHKAIGIIAGWLGHSEAELTARRCQAYFARYATVVLCIGNDSHSVVAHQKIPQGGAPPTEPENAGAILAVISM